MKAVSFCKYFIDIAFELSAGILKNMLNHGTIEVHKKLTWLREIKGNGNTRFLGMQNINKTLYLL